MALGSLGPRQHANILATFISLGQVLRRNPISCSKSDTIFRTSTSPALIPLSKLFILKHEG